MHPALSLNRSLMAFYIPVPDVLLPASLAGQLTSVVPHTEATIVEPGENTEAQIVNPFLRSIFPEWTLRVLEFVNCISHIVCFTEW